MKLIVQDLGLIEYEKAFTYQEKLVLDVQNGAEDHLLLLEHPKVITLGINAKTSNVLLPESVLMENGYQLVKTRRGGDVTYHGPGQLVGYTIFDLKHRHGGSIKTYVHNLEQLFIDLLKIHFDIDAQRDEINSGVFVGNSKILALGLAVKHGVTMHGFALNINTKLSDFNAIVPCGLNNRGVTSIEQLTGAPQDIALVKELVSEAFEKAFHFETKELESLTL